MLLLWDLDGGLAQIDKYMLSDDDNIKAGAFMAVGIVNSQVRDPCDPSLALLSGAVTYYTTINIDA
jgi:26S proteasome regulatory subunit N1